jgi:hypothetical protein
MMKKMHPRLFLQSQPPAWHGRGLSHLLAPLVLVPHLGLLLGCEVVGDVEGAADLLGCLACEKGPHKSKACHREEAGRTMRGRWLRMFQSDLCISHEVFGLDNISFMGFCVLSRDFAYP